MNVYSKNCRSLKADDDIKELLVELKHVQWDVVLMNEIWRVEGQEAWDTEEGHRFLGTGCDQGRKGVAVLLHQKWTKKIVDVEHINERIMIVDVKVPLGKMLRLIPAYFPDSTYPDHHIENVYNALAEAVTSAWKSKACVFVGADLNAILGDAETSSRYSSMGEHGYGTQNSRGQWAATWTSAQHLQVLNSRFRKRPEKLWTYTSPSGIKKQFDYFFCDRFLL